MRLPDVEIIPGTAMMAEDYMVEFALSPESMREKVLELIAQGWCVYGGIALACEEHRACYAQALVKPLPMFKITVEKKGEKG